MCFIGAKVPYFVIMICALAVLAGCVASRGKRSMKLIEDPALVKKLILKEIPVGTRVEDAKAIMEANEFDCRFVALDERPHLYCVREEGISLLVGGKWQVLIPHEGGLTKGVAVTYGRVGP